MKNVFGLMLVAGLAVPAIASEPVSRDEVRSMVAEMMADAETRSSLLQGGATAGYDKNFFLASADNKFRLNIFGYTQIRYTASFGDKGNTLNGTTGGEFRNGFNLRRTVVGFKGNAGSENLTYMIRVISLDNGSFGFDDAYVEYNLGGGWGIKAGQYKVGFFKETNNSDNYTLTADRGIVESFFGQSRSQGVQLNYTSDNYDASIDFTDGLRGQGRTTFGAGSDTSATTALNEYVRGVAGSTASASDFAITARGEWRFAGTKNQLKDYTSRQDEKFAGNVGVAGHYEGSANNNQADADADNRLVAYTVDAQIEGGGFTAFLAGVGTNRSFNSATTAVSNSLNDLNDWGVVAQAGFRVLPDTEIFGKYEWMYLDRDHGTAATQFQRNYHFLTVGANQYFAGNAAKLTVDAVIALAKTGSDAQTDRLIGGTSGTNTRVIGNGLNGNALGLTGSNKGVEVALRAQLQVMF